MVWPKLRARRGPVSRSSARDDRRLDPARFADDVGEQRGVALEERRQIGRQPIEQRPAGDHPVFDDLVEPGAELAARQRGEQVGVDRDGERLMEGADQVLAERMIDADLAADRAVHLRQQRRRHLDDRDAAEERRGRESGDVADHAAANRHDRRSRDRRPRAPARRRCGRPSRPACDARRQGSGSALRWSDSGTPRRAGARSAGSRPGTAGPAPPVSRAAPPSRVELPVAISTW